jgi:CheY-like chemotaxis protein
MLDDTVTASATPAPDAEPIRILVVDDQDAVRRLTTRLLTRNGYEVDEAPDGATALQRCAAAPGPPDLLLTDLVLPGMTGTELRDRIHEVAPEVPVLFMTGFTGPVQERYGLRAGVDTVIGKPFNAGELLDAVVAALAPRR